MRVRKPGFKKYFSLDVKLQSPPGRLSARLINRAGATALNPFLSEIFPHSEADRSNAYEILIGSNHRRGSSLTTGHVRGNCGNFPAGLQSVINSFARTYIVVKYTILSYGDTVLIIERRTGCAQCIAPGC